ncbi:hypothetical protein CONPUDRAFT_158411 [Coniophora puteana RWD-64-598 SS2]|uniref:F-box domain-containing protein n=1 Tax=Coniophora puteana (strain RWD-64-598) TaxID=741705 RepID=A0A5M3MBW6_CONPW|nr:uncharacterized protein CONPUDRAFT_158411 [Coniophora puteana RWD-64-598 SS2]EIW76384.1 hypothetical protein CONPUDRAFT_158411 [Coniophora puteana RWD-64-598 SS2]
MSLPAEVLLMIFYWTHQGGWPGSEAYTAYKLAFVCRTWLEVAAMMKAEYWGFLRVITDEPTFLPSVIRRFFSIPRGEDDLIKLVIGPQHKDSPSLTPSQEQARLNLVMECMKPHLGRVSDLQMDTFYRSTIVTVSHFMDGADMDHLNRLWLVSQVTDDTSPLQISSLKCPYIESLDIDAQSFVNLMDPTHNVSFTEDDQDAEIRLTRYRPPTSTGAISPSRLVEALVALDKHNIISLTIEDVELSQERYGGGSRLVNLDSLTLRKIDGSFVPMICQALDSRELSFVEINSSEITSHYQLPAVDLYLTGVQSSTSLLYGIQDWKGIKLFVKDCPGFDDWVLGAMAFFGMKDNGPACGIMNQLVIYGCSFSAPALQRMCEMRYGKYGIDHLEVRDGPEIDDDLRRWFTEHTLAFEWQARELCIDA